MAYSLRPSIFKDAFLTPSNEQEYELLFNKLSSFFSLKTVYIWLWILKRKHLRLNCPSSLCCEPFFFFLLRYKIFPIYLKLEDFSRISAGSIFFSIILVNSEGF